MRDEYACKCCLVSPTCGLKPISQGRAGPGRDVPVFTVELLQEP